VPASDELPLNRPRPQDDPPLPQREPLPLPPDPREAQVVVGWLPAVGLQFSDGISE